MSFISSFQFEPAEWLPFRDREILDRVAMEKLADHQGKVYEHPDFEVKVVNDVHNFFAADLFCRIRLAAAKKRKLVLILPSPENAVFRSVVESLNRYEVSCSEVHVFFLYEYANEKREPAPWQSPFSRSGAFMRNFYFPLREHLRMPLEQIHFWTKDNTDRYSELIEAEGGADAAYTALSWSGGIGAIDAESFPAESMEELMKMGSRFAAPMPELLAHDSLRGMFGLSGDISGVPPYVVTVGPRDLAAARDRIHVQYLTPCGGVPAHQKFPLKLSLLGPVGPKNPGSLMRLMPGTCYISADVAADAPYEADVDWLEEKIEEIRKREA